MSDIEFFKATSGGKLESIENSTNSLHYRRSIIIKDEITFTLWLIHGSGVSDKTRESAEDNASKLQLEGDHEYKIVRVDPDDAVDVIEDIFANKEIASDSDTSKNQPSFSMEALPKVPKVKSVEVDYPRPKGEDDSEGPEIKEFQIAYFEEEKKPKEAEPDLIKQVLQKVSVYIEELDQIIEKRPSKSKAKSILGNLSDDIITLIYQ